MVVSGHTIAYRSPRHFAREGHPLSHTDVSSATYCAQTRTSTRFGARILAAACALALTLGASSAAHASDPWTLVVVPDTQHYVDNSNNLDDFTTQMQWIADNISERNIAFVSHLGDVVQHGDRSLEWDRAELAMEIIDDEVPYGVAIGDHDYNEEERRSSGAPEYIARFGAARYAGRSWYGGASPDEKSHYQVFSAGGRSFLHLTLEWEAPGSPADSASPIGWAHQVLRAHADMPTIISTHSYVWDEEYEEGRTNGIEEDGGNGTSGEQIWSALIANQPQVFMVLNGNFHNGSSQFEADDPSGPSSDGEFHQVASNLHGLPVYEMLSNYQDYPNGGDGWIRLITFEEGGGQGNLDRIRVQTYSTTLDAYQTDGLSEFSFDLDFAARFDAIPPALDLQRTTVTSGADTYVWAKYENSNYGDRDDFRVDSVDYGLQQSLLRFDFHAGALPAGAQVVRAELHLRLQESGNGFRMHRMRVPWEEQAVTWRTMDGGVDIDGSEAEAEADLITRAYMSDGESPGYSIFDVTASVQAWAQGAENHGWVMEPLGGDKLSFDSFDSGDFVPVLVVDYLGVGAGSSHTSTVHAGEDAHLWRKYPDQNYGADSRIRIDYSDGKTSNSGIMPMQGLLRFDVAAAVPEDATVTSARLRVRLTDSGNGFRLHRVLRAWSEDSVTWNSFGEGVDDDDVDAASLPDAITSDYLSEPSSAAYIELAVTGAVQAWVQGQANHGWALLPLGDDKLLIESMQGSELRPELVIDYTLP